MVLRCKKLAGIFDEAMKKDLSAKQRTESKEFDWDKFLNRENRIAVHCKTEEEAEDFCRKMHEHGMKWSSGISYLESTNYNIYIDYICYSNDRSYGNKQYYEEEGYKILEWSDYMVGQVEQQDRIEEEKIIDILLDDNFKIFWDREKGRDFRKHVMLLMLENKRLKGE